MARWRSRNEHDTSTLSIKDLCRIHQSANGAQLGRVLLAESSHRTSRDPVRATLEDGLEIRPTTRGGTGGPMDRRAVQSAVDENGQKGPETHKALVFKGLGQRLSSIVNFCSRRKYPKGTRTQSEFP